jgi:hypothetical protein
MPPPIETEVLEGETVAKLRERREMVKTFGMLAKWGLRL